MIKHTPAPWRVQRSHENGRISIELYGGDGLFVCRIEYHETDDIDIAGQVEETARLIGGAPKLLDLLDDVSASLETLLAQHGETMGNDFAPRHALCKRARELCDSFLRSAPELDEVPAL